MSETSSAEDAIVLDVYARLTEESSDLENKLTRLRYALKWNNQIPEPQRLLMVDQEKAMRKYWRVLKERMTMIMDQLDVQ